MKEYLNTLHQILQHGTDHTDRTGVGRRSIFGVMNRFNLTEGFPAVTTRKLFFKTMVAETLWFLTGSNNVQNLQIGDKHVALWDNWAVADKHIESFVEKYKAEMGDEAYPVEQWMKANMVGSVGHMYGAAWRNFITDGKIHQLWPNVTFQNLAQDKQAECRKKQEQVLEQEGASELTEQELAKLESLIANYAHYSAVDQISNLVDGLKKRPWSSRHMVVAWSPSVVPFEELSPQENVLLGRAALAPCHYAFQCFVTPHPTEKNVKRLSMKVDLRSNDYPVGATFNIAQYSLLLSMLAQVTGMQAYELVYSVGDCHIYSNQIDLVKQQLTRTPLPAPTLWINPEVKDIFEFKQEDFRLENYNHHDNISYPVAI